MTDFRSHLNQIAEEFISAMLSAMKNSSLADFASAAPTGQQKVGTAERQRRGATRSGVSSVAGGSATKRRRRASAEEVERLKEVALAAARALKSDFSKGDVMKKSGSKVDLGRALSLLVAEGKLSKKGNRRLTQYAVK
jgi:hypothetical protein